MLRSLLTGLAAAGLAAAPTSPTVDELIAKNIEARGGRERMKSVETIRMTGRMSPGPGMEAPISLELKRPDRIRMEVTFQGMTAVQAYDGHDGWVIVPFAGKMEPQRMSAEDVQQAVEQADIDGPLLDYKAKGHAVELVGPDQVDGKDAWKLKLTLKNGTVRYVYLEGGSLLEIKSESKRTIRGVDVEVEGWLGDYREVGGMRYPHSIQSGAKGRPERQRVSVEKIELNPALDDARFRFPAAASPAPPK